MTSINKNTKKDKLEKKEDKTLRKIRSFVLRTGRLTGSQKVALEDLWPKFGIDSSESILDYTELFGNSAPVTLEIGYGMGSSLAEMALADPKRNFLGIEVHLPGIGNLLKLIQQDHIQNLRLLDDDAVQVLEKRITDESLERVHLYFPDPWPKKKHHKRRIVQPDFLKLLAKKLKPDGTFHMATDWQEYAEHMAEVMEASDDFMTINDSGSPYIDRPDFRPITKFENRGLRLGHGVWDLIYKRVS